MNEYIKTMNTVQSPVEQEESSYIPMFFLYAFIIMEYIRPSFLPPQITLGFAMLLLISAIFYRMRGKAPVAQIKLIMIFNIVCVASIVFAIFFNQYVEPNITLARDIFMAVLGYSIILYAMVYVLDSHKKIVHYFTAMVVVMFLVTVLNIQNISQIQRGYLTIGGIFLGDGNDFAMGLNVIVPFSYYLIGRFENRIMKFGMMAILGILIIGVIFTQSRGGILGLASIFLYLSFFSRRRIQLMILITVAAVIIIAVFGETYLARMETLSDYEEDSSAMGRINAWKAAFAMLSDRPLFGIGLGNFAWAYGIYYKPPEVTWMVWRAAHSFFFQVLGELGLAGIITYMALIITNFKYARRIYKDALEKGDLNRDRFGKTLFASQLGFLVSGAFLSTAYYPHIFLLSGVIAAAYSLHLRGTTVDLFVGMNNN